MCRSPFDTATAERLKHVKAFISKLHGLTPKIGRLHSLNSAVFHDSYQDVQQPKPKTSETLSNQAQTSSSKAAISIRLLIIRFSSFGDIVQALSAPFAFKEKFQQAEIDWLVRQDFAGLLMSNPALSEVLAFDRRQTLWQLINLSWQLSARPYTHLYDAHSNLRSAVVLNVFRLRELTPNRLWACVNNKRPRLKVAIRSKHRLRRFLYFKLGFKTLPEPFRGSASFLWPLEKWGVSAQVPSAPLFNPGVALSNRVKDEIKFSATKPQGNQRRLRVALVASAAWEMKRWPVVHFQKLIELWPEANFVLLGGPSDGFLNDIAQIDPNRILNLAGQLSLAESSELLNHVDLVIANDTGLLHVSDQLGRPTLALIGPSAFGYPSQKNSYVAELQLACKPCSKDGRGRCHNSVYQRCLQELTPEVVLKAAQQIIDSSHSRTSSDFGSGSGSGSRPDQNLSQ